MSRTIVTIVATTGVLAAFAVTYLSAPSAIERAALGDIARDIAGLRKEVTEVKEQLAGIDRALERNARATWSGFTASAGMPAPSSACPVVPKPADQVRAPADRDNPHLREAEAVVNASLAHGTWTQQDIERFREQVRAASDLDWLPLMQRIDQAINDGRLRPDPELAAFH